MLRVFRLQSLPVYLAICIVGHACHPDKTVRLHVMWNPLLKRLKQLRLVLLPALVDEHDLVRRIIVYAGIASDTVYGSRCRLDLAELYAVTHVFYLIVLTAHIDQLAVSVVFHQITGLVDQLWIVRIQRILDKCLSRLLRISEVAQRHK